MEEEKISKVQVPPRFELGSLDSESRVLTITPWDQHGMRMVKMIRFKEYCTYGPFSFTRCDNSRIARHTILSSTKMLVVVALLLRMRVLLPFHFTTSCIQTT